MTVEHRADLGCTAPGGPCVRECRFVIPPRVSPRDYEDGYTAAVADVIEHGLEVAMQEVRNMRAAHRPAVKEAAPCPADDPSMNPPQP